MSLGGGDDRFQPTEIGTTVTFGEGALAVDLGDGADTYDAESTNAMAVVQGGGGNDTLLGSINADHLHGGDGDDKLDRREGRGRAARRRRHGHPQGRPPVRARDLRRRPRRRRRERPPRRLRLQRRPHARAAGHDHPRRPGQRRARRTRTTTSSPVERIKSGSAGSFTGDDQDNEFAAPEVGPPGTLLGNGGDDVLIAGDAHGDTVDGGAGADLVEGGFGDDRLVGGPGRDTVNGDRKSRCNEYSCDVFVAGNDTIEVRDGEVDSVTCGTGTDRVVADHDDVVAADCETVDRAPQRGGPGEGPDGPGKATARRATARRATARAQGAKVRLTIRGVPLARALRRGLPVQVTRRHRHGAPARAARAGRSSRPAPARAREREGDGAAALHEGGAAVARPQAQRVAAHHRRRRAEGRSG